MSIQRAIIHLSLVLALTGAAGHAAQAHEEEDQYAALSGTADFIESTDAVLVFVKTRSATEPLAEHLAKSGLKTAALNGDIAQKQRQRIVDALRSGKVDVIVATDVAARGLDVQRISHVVNYDLPYDSEAYIHRIGRTGRAGRSGEAILFVHPRERRLLKRLEHATRQKIEPMDLPSNRAINKQRVARFHQSITQALDSAEIETFQAIVEHYQRENEAPLELIAASLARLANGETPLLVKEELRQVGFAEDSQRGPRGQRSKAQKREFSKDCHAGARSTPDRWDTYRIEVGRSHRVQPGDIVGAIAHGAGVDGKSIGKIKIFDHHSTVDLAGGIPPELFETLKHISVSGRKLQISRMGDSRGKAARFQEGNRRFGKAKFKKRKQATKK